MRPYYEHGGIAIYHADCRDVLPHLGVGDAVLTDPPYGTGVTEWDTSIGDDLLVECAEAAGNGYAAFFYSNTRLHHILNALKRTGRDVWVAGWHKPNSVGFERKFAPQWSPIVVAYRKPAVFWGQDVCRHPITPQAGITHPTPKPVGVMRWLVERATRQGQLVIDPFCGSGTTLQAAKELGRRAIGIEINERYCEEAATRLQQDMLPIGIV